MKAKKVKAIAVLAIVWVMAFIQLLHAWSKGKDKEADIVTAFASGDYISTVGTISAYANLGKEYMSDEEKKNIINKIASSIGIEGQIEIETVRDEKSENESVISSSFSRKSSNAVTDISIVTIEHKQQDNTINMEQYILADISINNSLESTVYYDEKLQNAFEDMDISADVTLSLNGCVEGSMSNSEKNRICEDIIEKLDGKLVIGSRSDELYSVYAYTEKISDYVLNGTTKSNINIAITYDSNKDVTWIYMATPIIGESY